MRAYVGHPCLYDWRPRREGEVLECRVHRHGAGGSTVIVRPGSPTLAEMLALGLLAGQALEEAGSRPKRGELVNVHGIVITDEDLPF